MLETPLRALAVIASLFVIAGFAGFVIDETGSASKRTQAQIAGDAATSKVNPSPDEERAREKIHSKAREVIDDANDVLLRPFAFATDGSSSRWTRRGAGAMLALAVYGFGVSYLARFSHGRA